MLITAVQSFYIAYFKYCEGKYLYINIPFLLIRRWVLLTLSVLTKNKLSISRNFSLKSLTIGYISTSKSCSLGYKMVEKEQKRRSQSSLYIILFSYQVFANFYENAQF